LFAFLGVYRLICQPIQGQPNRITEQPTQMPTSRYYKWLLIILCGIAIFWLILVPAFFHFLPIYLETRLIPHLSLKAGIDPHEIRVRRIGWRGADLGPMRLGLRGQTVLQVAAAQLDYSLVSLLRGRIDRVVISGVRIEARLNAEGTGIAGLDDLKSAPTHQAERQAADPNFEKELPISIGRLVIPDGRINAHWGAHSVSVPFKMDLSTAAMEGAATEDHTPLESITGTMRVGPEANALHAWGTLNVRTRRMALSFKGQDLDPSALHAFLESTPLNRIMARIDLQADIQGRLEPFELTSLVLESRAEGLELTTPDFALQNTLDDRNRPIPIVARLTMENQGPWQWSVAPFQLNRPAVVHVTRLNGALTLVETGWRSQTQALSIVPAQLLDTSSEPSVALRQPLAMLWRLTARSADGTSIEFEIDGSGQGDPKQNRLAIQSGDMVADSAPPSLSVAGTYDGRAVQADFESSLADLRLASPGFTVSVPDSLVTGTLGRDQTMRIEATAQLPLVRIVQGTVTARLARTRLDARLTYNDGLQWTLAGEFNLPEGDISDSANDVKVLGLSARLPFIWPLDTQAPAGDLKAGPIWWQAQNMGDIEGHMELLPQGFFAKATHRSKLFPGLNVLFDTRVFNGEALAGVTVPEYVPAAEIDLGRFFKAATGFRANGRIAAQADLIVKGTTVDAQGRIKIDQGTVRHPDSGLALHGIALELRMQDLLSLRSAPAQQLRVASMTFGKINATDLQIDFQLEPSRTLFVEHAGLQWSQGTLQTQAFRLKPELDDVMVTLYCDRLNLAMVLDQLGVAEASGDGTVNGRIPMRWREGQLSFDNGFLYSTPGQTGTIVLQGTDFLLEGLPVGSPQHTQLDIATEALKDYTYQWATLRMETHNADLVLGLQLDGKPNRLLPFAYDPQSGGFVRYKGEGQAEFKGIRIDLNFTTPLNEILDYRSLFAPISR
jgi:hypothetical protein